MTTELLMLQVELNSDTPDLYGEFAAASPEPDADEIIDQALQLRLSANKSSDMRVELADPICGLVRNKPEHFSGRLAVAATVAWLWHTDRQDGKQARKSVAIAQNLIESQPDLADHPTLQYLTSEVTKADGAKRDEKADKVLSKAIQRGLREKAAEEGDAFTATVLGLTDTSSEIRDKKMNEVRELGREHGIDVKAGFFGKMKTLMKSLGQEAIILGKRQSVTGRIGSLFVGASIIPEWLGYHRMKRHVAKELRAKQRAS